MSVLDVERDGELALATVNRPHALNAVNFEVMAALESWLDELEADESARVFALTGAGTRCFISGGDLREFSTLKSADDATKMATRMRDVLDRIEALDCWTIALINADAYGGGCETALAFDFRIASTDARLGFTQARFNVAPGWGGLTRLVELVGRPTALKWLARAERVSADEAHRAGLLDATAEPDQLRPTLDGWVERLATDDRRLIRALKQGARRAQVMSRDESIDAELPAFAKLWSSDAHHETIARFLQRSDPDAND